MLPLPLVLIGTARPSGYLVLWVADFLSVGGYSNLRCKAGAESCFGIIIEDRRVFVFWSQGSSSLHLTVRESSRTQHPTTKNHAVKLGSRGLNQRNKASASAKA